MATLIRLLLIKIVASSKPGFSSNLSILLEGFEESLLNDFISEGPNEKYATSELEIIAEQRISKINTNSKISVTEENTVKGISKGKKENSKL